MQTENAGADAPPVRGEDDGQDARALGLKCADRLCRSRLRQVDDIQRIFGELAGVGQGGGGWWRGGRGAPEQEESGGSDDKEGGHDQKVTPISAPKTSAAGILRRARGWMIHCMVGMT